MRTPGVTILALALSGFSFQAQADHNDIFSSYAYVHEQCFPGGQDGGCGAACDDALDQCGGYYEKAERRPTPPVKFATKENPQLKAKIMSTFKVKRQ